MKFVVMNYAFKMVETTFFTASSKPASIFDCRSDTFASPS